MFASTSADVTVGPKEDLKEAVPSGRTATVPASLRERVAKVEGVADAHVDASVDNITVVDGDNEPVGSTTGAPTVATNWYPTDRSPVELTSGHALARRRARRCWTRTRPTGRTSDSATP